jgi:hypothetical protein
MELEQLNKTQIVLLTLLTSFITSIATGIVTVTLLDQAPPAVTQTINRIVEKTIERVVPSQEASVINVIKETVIKESDLVVKAIEKGSKSLVRIYTNNENKKWVGLGLVISKEGIILTNNSFIEKERSYSINSGYLTVINHKTNQLVSLLQWTAPEEISTSTSKVIFVPAKLGDSNKLKLGQNIIILSGKESDKVSSGIVSQINPEEISVSAQTESLSGELLLNLSGEIVAINIQNKFIPINLIKKQIASVSSPKLIENEVGAEKINKESPEI